MIVDSIVLGTRVAAEYATGLGYKIPKERKPLSPAQPKWVLGDSEPASPGGVRIGSIIAYIGVIAVICRTWVRVLAGEIVVQERLQTEYFHLYLEGNVFAIETIEIRVLNDPYGH